MPCLPLLRVAIPASKVPPMRSCLAWAFPRCHNCCCLTFVRPTVVPCRIGISSKLLLHFGWLSLSRAWANVRAKVGVTAHIGLRVCLCVCLFCFHAIISHALSLLFDYFLTHQVHTFLIFSDQAMQAMQLLRLLAPWRMELLPWGWEFFRYGCVLGSWWIGTCVSSTHCAFCPIVTQDFTAATEHAQADQRLIAPTAFTVAEYLGMKYPVCMSMQFFCPRSVFHRASNALLEFE
jgi:hypothetical protein